jgi:hypothetical protein
MADRCLSERESCYEGTCLTEVCWDMSDTRWSWVVRIWWFRWRFESRLARVRRWMIRRCGVGVGDGAVP